MTMNRKGSFRMAVALLLGTALTTVMPGVTVRAAQAASAPTLADQFFQVKWSASPDRHGERISGYVYNQYGEAAQNVQLRISELDATGHATSSVIRQVPGTVPAGDRAYFSVHVPKSPAYQVGVKSFDFIELRGNA
jgi:hypothetical protein